MIDKQVSMEMLKTVNMIKRNIDQRIATGISRELTASQGHVLTFVRSVGQDRDIFQKDIEEAFALQRSAVSLMLSNMEKNGLIQRISVTEDKRLKKIVLTEKAVDYQTKMCTIMLEERDFILQNITAEEQATMIVVLGKMQQNLK